MTQKRQWDLKNRDGHVLHSGKFVTKKDFIQHLIDRGASFRDADMRDLDLSHMRLDGLDFTGANLAGAKLRGSTANKTRFDNADLSGVRAEGMTARQASFMHVTVGKHRIRGTESVAFFDGAQLTYSSFDGAMLDQASFEGCSMSGATFDYARLKRCILRNARLNNADFSRSEILQCNLEHAELNATTAAFRLPRASLPNRTVDTIAVGNNYKGAVIDETTPIFKWDRTFNGIDQHVAWGVSTAAMLAATAFMPVDPSGEWLGKLVGQGVVMMGAVALLSLLKEKLSQKVQDRLADVTLNLQLSMRTATAELLQRGANVKETVAALGRGSGIKALTRALAATSANAEQIGIMPLVKALAAGDTNVILCDRGHMALALEWLSSSFARSKLLKRDLIISRVGHEDDAAPSILKFFAGGGMAAFWTRKGEVSRTLTWAADDMVPEQWSVKGVPPAGPMQAMHARQMFENAVIRDHLPGAELTYDRLTQQLRAGKDGSIVVTGQRDQLPRNPNGPVLIRPDGERLSERQARDMLRRENNNDDGDALPSPGL